MSYQKFIGYKVWYRYQESLTEIRQREMYLDAKTEITEDKMIERAKNKDSRFIELVKYEKRFKHFRDIYVSANCGLSIDNLRTLRELSEIADINLRSLIAEPETRNVIPGKIHSFKGQIKFKVMENDDIEVVGITDPGDPYNWGHISKNKEN